MSPYKSTLTKTAFFLLISIISSGCANLSQYEQDIFTHQLSGKIGLRETSKRASWLLFQWQYNVSHDEIRFLNPLGKLEATIFVSPDKARVQYADGSHQQARSAEALFEQMSGYPFPITGIKAWSTGTLRGDETGITKDNGLIRAFTLAPWSVQLSNYKSIASEMIPHKIRFHHPKGISVTFITKIYEQQ